MTDRRDESVVEIDAMDVAEWERDRHTPLAPTEGLAELVKKTADASGPVSMPAKPVRKTSTMTVPRVQPAGERAPTGRAATIPRAQTGKPIPSAPRPDPTPVPKAALKAAPKLAPRPEPAPAPKIAPTAFAKTTPRPDPTPPKPPPRRATPMPAAVAPPERKDPDREPSVIVALEPLPLEPPPAPKPQPSPQLMPQLQPSPMPQPMPQPSPMPQPQPQPQPQPSPQLMPQPQPMPMPQPQPLPMPMPMPSPQLMPQPMPSPQLMPQPMPMPQPQPMPLPSRQPIAPTPLPLSTHYLPPDADDPLVPARAFPRKRLAIIAAAAGALLLVIVVVAVAASGGSKPAAAPPDHATAAAALQPSPRASSPAPTPPPPPTAAAAADPTTTAPPPGTPPPAPAAAAPAHRYRKPVVLDYDNGKRAAPVATDPGPQDDGALSRARAAYDRGNQQLFAGDPDAAVHSYREALAAYPSYVAGYRGLGLAYALAGDKAQALQAFRTYVGIVPRAKDVALIKKRMTMLAK